MSWKFFIGRDVPLTPPLLSYGVLALGCTPLLRSARHGASFHNIRGGRIGMSNGGSDRGSNVDASGDTRAANTAAGWCYEEVDPVTGRTPLDVLYEQRLQRIKAVFESPLPALPCDGNANPDLLIGFAYYDYRLRDQYRAIVARGLSVPVAAVRLSVAWSGRFDVSRFNRVQKVCGVCVEPAVFSASAQERADDDCMVKPTTSENETGARQELRRRVSCLVRIINERQNETFLSFRLTQAAEALPEVELAVAELESVAAQGVYKWLRERVLKPDLAVVVYGSNSTVNSGSAEGVSKGSYGEGTADAEANRDSERARRRDDDIERQRMLIERRWLKAFSHRRIVPRVLSLDELAAMLCAAVRDGEVENDFVSHNRGLMHFDSKGESNPPRSRTGRGTVEGTSNQAVQRESPSTTKIPSEDVGAWRRLLRKAVFHGREGRAMFPVIFVHGEWAGGVEEMRYLLHNKEAVDALLLHPNDVAFKKKFMSRLRTSHSRLRMTEELSG